MDALHLNDGDLPKLEKALPELSTKYGGIEHNSYGNDDYIEIDTKTLEIANLLEDIENLMG